MQESIDSQALVPQQLNRVNENLSSFATTNLAMSVMDQEQREDKIERHYQELGGFGKFQAFASVTILLGLTSLDLWFQELGYFTQAPDSYICTYAGQDDQPPCTKDNICSGNPAIISWEADPDSNKTLYNWNQRLDLTCVDDWKVSMLGTWFFVGWCATMLWIPNLGDKYGRKKLFWIGMVIMAVCNGVQCFTKSLVAMSISIFTTGMVSSIRANVGYVYLMELLPR